MSDELLLQEMGSRIYQRRKALGYTQEYVADRMNVSVQMISNLELGKKAIRPENLKKVGEVLSVSTDYLLFGTPTDSPVGRISQKLVSLDPEQLQLVEQVVDLCLKAEGL